MNKIYVVFGASGEYSDHSEWPVAAYESEEEARKHVVAAQQNAGEIRAARSSAGGATWDLREKFTKAAKYDNRMENGYSWQEVNYYIVTVDVFASFDKYERPKE